MFALSICRSYSLLAVLYLSIVVAFSSNFFGLGNAHEPSGIDSLV